MSVLLQNAVADTAPVAMLGGYAKLPAEQAVPAGVVTQIGPVVPPTGAVTVRPVLVLPVMVPALAATPLNVTAVAPLRLVPVRVTLVPAPPPVGVKLVMLGLAQLK